jgi:hypothetical protein
MLEDPRLKMSRDSDAEPIVEDTRRPLMTERARPPRRISGKVQLMPDEPTPPPKRGTNRMSPVPNKTASGRQARERPEQLDPKPGRRGSTQELGYVRLHVHVENGEMSVQDITAVEGPLIEHTPLQGDLAYEVLIGGKRVASGSIPDVGVMRSFPHPDAAQGQEGHYITPATSFDFLVRIPKEAVSENNLRRMQIPLYRIKEAPLPQTEGPESLGERFEKELREVGRIRGVKLEELPRSAQAQARRALR